MFLFAQLVILHKKMENASQVNFKFLGTESADLKFLDSLAPHLTLIQLNLTLAKTPQKRNYTT